MAGAPGPCSRTDVPKPLSRRAAGAPAPRPPAVPGAGPVGRSGEGSRANGSSGISALPEPADGAVSLSKRSSYSAIWIRSPSASGRAWPLCSSSPLTMSGFAALRHVMDATPPDTSTLACRRETCRDSSGSVRVQSGDRPSVPPPAPNDACIGTASGLPIRLTTRINGIGYPATCRLPRPAPGPGRRQCARRDQRLTNYSARGAGLPAAGQ